MQKTFVSANMANQMEAEVDGIKYEFRLEKFENIDGYAPMLIKDLTNEEVYHSYGYLELNGHIFISKWTKEYSDYRNNWVCTQDLIVEII